MPTIMLRGVAPDLVARIKAFADRRGLKLPAAVLALVESGLNHQEARSAGGQARSANQTPEERSDQARAAAEARWRKPDSV